MKHITKILCLAAGLLGATSCSDFLDQTSPSEMTGQNVFGSAYYTGLAINKLYGAMAQDDTYSQAIPIVWSTNTDCELIDGLGDNATASNERGVMNYNSFAGWNRIARLWDAMYGIIENANLAIEGIDKSPLLHAGGADATAMRRYKGEALTIRAMVYFDLVRFFGDIPLKLESSKPDLSNAYLGKTDRDVILDTLMNDLDEAIELLPWAGTNSTYTTERVTRGYAHALLAQIALTRAGWVIREQAKEGYETAAYTDPVYPTQRPGADVRKALYERALTHLSAVIQDPTHNLNPSFENEWYLLNQLKLDETWRENLFEVPFGEATGELGYTIGVRTNKTTDFGGNSSGKQKMTSTLFWSYQPGDTRRDITCCPWDLRQESNGAVETMMGNKPFELYCGKWDVRKMNSAITDRALRSAAAGYSKWMTGINCVRMRYPQVLLMYAETLNELSGSPVGSYPGDAGMTAKEALRLVHLRAFTDAEAKAEADRYIDRVSADKQTFFNAIVDENAWELAGEGFRKYDLIRWNLLAEKILQFKQDYLREMNDETAGYPAKLYFNYTDGTKKRIDFSTVTWHGLPEGKTKEDYDKEVSFWGSERTATTKQQLETNLPSISSGLVGDGVKVKNRYLMPIASTTLSASGGKLQNSYGF